MLMFLKKVKKNKKGYTLTELIVVVAILGILAAVATPMILNQVQKAKDSSDAANERTIENAYKIKIAEATSTPATLTSPADVSNFLGSTLSPIPKPNDTSKKFYLNTTTGDVQPSAASVSGYVCVNP
ncbi:MAG TPA: prepilin-type N-terminal cleavage/methylation domain-containing protein [Ruminiclostridium sp.]|nr:prepilin-type N-terminal cleavage/methylation domain-containing protein [Ruminiclostridium sp.]